MESIPLSIEIPNTGIILRQLTPEDAGPLFRLIDRDRPHLSQFGDETARKYPTEESVLQSITHSLEPNKLRFGMWEGGKLVGVANLTPSCALGHDGSGQLGYWVAKKCEGRGLATAVARALVDYARTRLFWIIIFGYVHEDNEASQKVLYRAGLRQVSKDADRIIQMRAWLRR